VGIDLIEQKGLRLSRRRRRRQGALVGQVGIDLIEQKGLRLSFQYFNVWCIFVGIDLIEQKGLRHSYIGIVLPPLIPNCGNRPD